MTETSRDRAFPIVVVGHVDHGKSTLVGRLLNDTGSLPAGKVEELEQISARRGMPFEWSFVLDALQVERDQGITVDTTQIWFKTPRRQYVIIDAPGHKEFLKNMVTGAAQADAAVLVIDAEQGVSEQTRRHAYLLHLLGVHQVAVAVNKMDLVGYAEARFRKVEQEITKYLGSLGISPSAVIPVSARHGDHVANESAAMPWYDGPTVVSALDGFAPRRPLADRPLRLPIQDVYKFDDRRVVVGRIETGRLRVGDTLHFTPGGRSARVAAIESWNRDTPPLTALAGQSVALRLDEEIFVERGQIASHHDDRPAEGHSFAARLFWLGRNPLRAGDQLKLKLATAEHRVTVDEIRRVIDVEDLSSGAGDEVPRGGVGEVVFRSRSRLAADGFEANGRTGRAVLQLDYHLVGGCVIDRLLDADVAARRNLTSVAQTVAAEARAAANGHEGAVMWFTGLSGAGKSTLAMALQTQLFERGYQTFVLDGDNVRQGLNRDLGFAPADRTENIRRVAEVARLFADAGMIVITAFISPTREDRAMARQIVGERFHEVFVEAPLEECEARDPKGLYKKARAGEIPEFTGVSAPYEIPDTAELTVSTARRSVDQSVSDLVSYVDRTFALVAGTRKAG